MANLFLHKHLLVVNEKLAYSEHSRMHSILLDIRNFSHDSNLSVFAVFHLHFDEQVKLQIC